MRAARAAGVAEGVNGRLDTVSQLEFFENVLQMALDRGRADAQRAGDLFVGLAAGKDG